MGKVRLDTFDNSWYHPGPKVKIIIWYFVNAIFLNSYWMPVSSFKVFLLNMFGAKVGEGVVIKPKVNVKYPWKLEIGNHVWIGEKVWIDNLDQVTIEDHACISQGALILIGNHNFKKSTFDLMLNPVVIKRGAWIGAKVVVNGGSTIEEHAIISVQSVAPKKTEPYAIYRGNPAEKVTVRKIQENS